MGGRIEEVRKRNGTDTWKNRVKDKERKKKKSGRFNPRMRRHFNDELRKSTAHVNGDSQFAGRQRKPGKARTIS